MSQIVVDESRILFSTGRSVLANGGIIGIRAGSRLDENDITIFEGYDGPLDPGGSIQGPNGEYVPYDAPDHGLTADERKELALYCIKLWMRYGGLSAPKG